VIAIKLFCPSPCEFSGRSLSRSKVAAVETHPCSAKTRWMMCCEMQQRNYLKPCQVGKINSLPGHSFSINPHIRYMFGQPNDSIRKKGLVSTWSGVLVPSRTQLSTLTDIREANPDKNIKGTWQNAYRHPRHFSNDHQTSRQVKLEFCAWSSPINIRISCNELLGGWPDSFCRPPPTDPQITLIVVLTLLLHSTQHLLTYHV